MNFYSIALLNVKDDNWLNKLSELLKDKEYDIALFYSYIINLGNTFWDNFTKDLGEISALNKLNVLNVHILVSSEQNWDTIYELQPSKGKESLSLTILDTTESILNISIPATATAISSALQAYFNRKGIKPLKYYFIKPEHQ